MPGCEVKHGIKATRRDMRRYLLYWFLANMISITFIVILSGTVQYYFPAQIPIGLGMYADSQLFFISWGIAIFSLLNTVFLVYYLNNTRRRR